MPRLFPYQGPDTEGEPNVGTLSLTTGAPDLDVAQGYSQIFALLGEGESTGGPDQPFDPTHWYFVAPTAVGPWADRLETAAFRAWTVISTNDEAEEKPGYVVRLIIHRLETDGTTLTRLGEVTDDEQIPSDWTGSAGYVERTAADLTLGYTFPPGTKLVLEFAVFGLPGAAPSDPGAFGTYDVADMLTGYMDYHPTTYIDVTWLSGSAAWGGETDAGLGGGPGGGPTPGFSRASFVG